MKKIMAFISAVLLIATLTACSNQTAASTPIVTTFQPATRVTTAPVATTQPTTAATLVPIAVEYEAEDLDADNDPAATVITLAGNMITVEGNGATVDRSIVTITSAGTYEISGVLNDGQIIVDTADQETVKLTLNGVQLFCSTSAPIYVANAEKTVITLAAGTENTVTDGDAYVFADPASDEPNAAIFSHDDLTIKGDGALIVNANYNNGIASQDDLKITGGTITVNAANDGLKGRDSIAIRDGAITINAGADGLQSTNEEEAEKGFISIEGGTLNITAGLDGIQAQTSLLVSGGGIAITTGGGSGNTSVSGGGMWGRGMMEGNPNKPTDSAKGLKAVVDLTITGGVITINSADDALHSNGSLTISDGILTLASGDDGIHADASLTIDGGDVNITQSYEGVESAIITINGGTIHVIASDDGFNTAGGADGSAVNGRPGMNQFAMSGNYYLTLHGGYIFIDAIGDGIDSNGPIEMTGGTVIVNGPTENMNGALDYMGTFNITGGFLIAVGSAGMAQAPSASSTQYSVMQTFESPQAAGTLVSLVAADGTAVLTFAPTKAYQSVVFSSPELKNGETYTVYGGGASSGTATDGLYTGGTYTPGSQVASFTISSIVTGGGAGGRFGGPGQMPVRPGGGNWRP
ncbi:MAG: carbohydrate-binding domain-containing protein [Anaerolineae bacterium]